MNKIEKLVRIYVHSVLKLSKYRPWGNKAKPKVIYIIDGTNYAGGLADRLRQIMGVYALCKHRNYDFGLLANHPFKMEDYLNPKYDWTVKTHEFTRNIFYAKPIYLGFQSKTKYLNLINLKNKQLHLFASVQWGFVKDYGFTFENLFSELFVPNPSIQKGINFYRTQYKSWDSLVFRFQDLLNDFNEHPIARYKNISLSEIEKLDLINKCLTFVENFAMKKSPDNRILVCSDSVTFLEKALKISGVFVIPGQITHMEYSQNSQSDNHLKSFLDFFMISESNSVFSVGTDIMYPSDFPLLAAAIKNKKFERILI